MKTKATPTVIGALLTLLLWVLAFAVLNAIYQGNLPWLLTGLAALLCPLAGGYLAARLSRTDGVRLGALSGLSAGLILLLAGVLASRLAPNTTLAGIGLTVVGALAGAAGALLYGRLSAGKRAIH